MTTAEPFDWIQFIRSILERRAETRELFRFDPEPHAALIRWYHRHPGHQDDFARAVADLLDRMDAVSRNAESIFHLIHVCGATKPSNGLDVLRRLLFGGAFVPLSFSEINLHTLLLSMCGGFTIDSAFADWIRADCLGAADIDHTLTGFRVLAMQGRLTTALPLFEQALSLARTDVAQQAIALEVAGLLHPWSDLRKWFAAFVRRRSPDASEWGQRLEYSIQRTTNDDSDCDRHLFAAMIRASHFALPLEQIANVARMWDKTGIEAITEALNVIRRFQEFYADVQHPCFGDEVLLTGHDPFVGIYAISRETEHEVCQILLDTAARPSPTFQSPPFRGRRDIPFYTGPEQ